jgi:hypothetical protein
MSTFRSAYCVACLWPRDDLTGEWIEDAIRGRAPVQIEASDDLAFPGIVVTPPPGSRCGRCGSTGPVVVTRRLPPVPMP